MTASNAFLAALYAPRGPLLVLAAVAVVSGAWLVVQRRRGRAHA